MNTLQRTMTAATFSLIGSSTIWASTETYLLSNNLVGQKKQIQDFSEWPQSLATQMNAQWVVDGEFANDDETMRTGGENAKVLFDGNTGSNWKSIAFTKWNSGHWVSLNLSFEQPYLIQAVDVWAVHEKTRDSDFVEILFSEDGINYIPHQRSAMPAVPHESKNFVKIPLRLDEPVLAQHMQMRIARVKSARQQQISEIAVWGSQPEEGQTYLNATDRPEVEFTIEKIQAGVAKLDWSAFKKLTPDVQSWKIYTSSSSFSSPGDPGVELLKKVSGKEDGTTLYPLTPNQNYYFAVNAVFDAGENPKVKSQACQMPQPLAMDTFSDMVAINHFWGGGGNRQKNEQRDHVAYETVALDLLAETGISQIRWWECSPKIVQKFYQKGIGVYTYPHGNNMETGGKLGIYAYSGPGNEPDLKTRPIQHYVDSLKKVSQKRDELIPDAVICAPSSGLEDHSIEWLDKFYELGGKDYFDVLDLHSYCKIAGGHQQPEGYPLGAPEAMYDNMRKIREVMKKHGDWGKPMISTEFGYSEAPANNPSGPISPLVKADYLVRGLIIHHVLGFKRVFLYSFFDEGNDLNFTEHTFGLIDYDLQKKPAFFAVKTLMDTLGDAVYEQPLGGLEMPSIGYSFQHRESEMQTIVLWDGTTDKVASFKTAASEVTLTTLLGEQLTLIPSKEGLITAPYGSSPIYLSAEQALEFVGSEKAQIIQSQSDWTLRPAAQRQIVNQAQSSFKLPLQLDGKISTAKDIRVIVSEPSAGVILDDHMTINDSQKEFSIDIALDQLNAPLQKLKIQIVQQINGLSTSKEYPFYLRRLQGKGAQVQFPDMEEPVCILSNEDITVSIDVARGARVLELIDNHTLSNQINMDYSMMPNLPSIPFAYGIWSTFNGKLKNAPMQLVEFKDEQLIVQASVGSLNITQEWKLNGSTLDHTIKLANVGSTDSEFKVEIHPEYTVGGAGESVTDVLFFPLSQGVERLPFWSGLGHHKTGDLTANWWAALDLVSKLSLEQTLDASAWAQPRVWFGQGSYNVELKTRPGLKIAAGASWQTQLSWTLANDKDEASFSSQ
ncbi:hypothetical protein SH580_15810 [Coraliomargarita algicola]|uniref:Fibronectin type-III domain-containing protein n=1 Tax=Coraliomargarita algicola TaxID=3092156 RepID=A0ABZ0RI82_9BACT|nr:hypothetical protein [Coraliomargarita sp. J2-16]WPJ94896.1 hypothetical protein SH580_15810 [Coraliomargarita sp. J2-16]